MLRQALLNILENAILFAKPGGTVAIDCAPAGNNFLLVTITDNGPGFPRGKEDDAFLAFERLEQTTGAISGAGLGLTIARYLIEAMGGKVDVDSGYREGARVRVELALVPADHSLGDEAL
jgi:two-component system sensor histidine kinase KdpD